MRDVAHARIRDGYRRLWVVMKREGWEVGKHRFYRVYCEEGLALRRKRPWRHATAVYREQRRPAAARNDIWSMDFVSDELTDGRRFRALTVIDLFTRKCPEILAGRHLRGDDVAAVLERLRFERGLPQRIYCDSPRVLARRSSTVAGSDGPPHRRSSRRVWGRADLHGVADRSVDVSSPSRLGGRVKTGHLWTPQNRPFRASRDGS